MALSISIDPATGRISPRGTDVVIPPENAGIGDLIYKASATDFIVIGRGTNSAASITKNSKTYTLYACIYGFVNGMAMICAPTDGGSMKWSNLSETTLTPRFGAYPLMRNGLTASYAQMNTAQNSNYIKGGSTAPVQLSTAYQATSLTKETFDASASADIKKIYKTWDEYIRQTLRVQGAPGTPFGAVTTGVKVHEFGRWMTRAIHAASSTDYPAANYCATYVGAYDAAGGGNWWLPSMFELGEMMIDEHWNKMNESNKNGFSVPGLGSNRWSCVLGSSGYAWFYYHNGMSNLYGFSNTFAVRPVSLFKLR